MVGIGDTWRSFEFNNWKRGWGRAWPQWSYSPSISVNIVPFISVNFTLFISYDKWSKKIAWRKVGVIQICPLLLISVLILGQNSKNIWKFVSFSKSWAQLIVSPENLQVFHIDGVIILNRILCKYIHIKVRGKIHLRRVHEDLEG